MSELETIVEKLTKKNEEWLEHAQKTSNKSAQRKARVLSTEIGKLQKEFRAISVK